MEGGFLVYFDIIHSMSASSQLFEEATLKALRAERCRSVAEVLDRRRTVLAERHQPVTALHHEEVWRGRAATASRIKLRRAIGAALYSLALDLATASRALRGEASRLEQEATGLRARARNLAGAEARAAMRAEQLPEAPRGIFEPPLGVGSSGPAQG